MLQFFLKLLRIEHMAASTFYIPSVNIIGGDSLKDAMNTMVEYGFRRTLIVTDSVLT